MADIPPSKSMADAVPVDSAWIAELYEQYEAGLRRLVVGVLKDREAADDVIQATFAKAVQSAGNVQTGAIKAWLYRVAFHEAVTWKRRSDVDRKATRELWARGGGRCGEHPEQSLVRQETVEQVRQAMQSLSAVQQQVVRARIDEDKTFAQIATETGLPLGTVLTHMRRALIKLRQEMRGKE